MAEKKKQGEINSKVGPITGTPSGLDAATSLYDQDGNVITNTNIREDNAITRANPTDPNDPEARIGDYVLQQGGVAAVVPNSRTDLIRRYGAVTGGSTRQKLKLTDYSNALVNGFSAFMGAPTDTSNIATTVATSTVGQLVKGTPLKWFWAALNAADSLMKAQDAYTKAWADQEVDYDVALDFSTDEDGREIAKVNYEKMKDAGVGSGADVLKATDTENSDVALLEDNNLSVNVSPAFASSDLYKNIISQVKDAYPNLTQEMANTVINEETGATVLDTIKRVILSQESQYYYNARAIYDFKQIAPDASAKSLEEASYTQLIGAMNQDSLKEMTVTVYNDTNEAVEVNAEEYLNSIKDMDDKGRENYMVSLGNRIQSEDISDDEKAVLQAQANALYMASNSDGAYKDMYKKDFWDSVADTRTLLFGIRAGSIFGIDELTTFEDNELYRAGLDLTTGVTRAWVTAKAMGAIEKLERAGISALGSKIGDNALGRALSSVNTYAPQGENFHLHDIGAGMSAASYLGRTSVQNLTQLAADATFDLAKMGAYAATGEDYDFWSELRTDFLIDTLMTYGPSAYVESTEAPKYERRRVAYMGDDSKGNTLDDIKRVEDDEFYSGEYEGPYGRGLYEVKMVELTADELAKRRAEKLDKLTDTKVGMKVQELFFDRNAAMGKLAAQIRGTVSGDNYYFRKMLRYSGDIRQLTKDVLNEYKSRESAQKALGGLEAVIREIAPKTRDWTKADDRYVNAMINQTRFLEQWKGDKNTEASIREKYKDAINGVSPERAAQLNRYIDAMRTVAADAMDFYVERGVLTKKGLADLRKNPTYKKGIYAPVWTKGRTSGDGEILQGRATIKSVFDPKVLIDVKDLESPIVTIGSFLNNVARNVAINERALAIREAASVAGVKIHLTEDTGGALSDVKNLRELNENFEKKYQNIVKEVREAIPTRKQWQKINDELILKSASMKRASELEALKAESKELKNELRRTRAAQEKALRQNEDPEYYARFKQGQDLSDKYRDNISPRQWSVEDAIIDSVVYRDDDMPSDNRYGSTPQHNIAHNLEWTLGQILNTGYGKKAFANELAEAGGDPAKTARNISTKLFQELIDNDDTITAIRSLGTSDFSRLEEYLAEKIESFFTTEQAETFRTRRNRLSVSRTRAAKQRMLEWWNATEGLRRRLGVEGYTYGLTSENEVSNGNAYGNYNFAGWDGRGVAWSDGELYTTVAPVIRIALSTFESLPEMKSTIVHEAAHAAFSRAANRVPLLTDALRILGVDADVSREMAASTAATELIAYMTQKKYLSEFLDKTPEQVMNRLRDDSTVQKHLNDLTKMMDKPPVNFKERFLDQIRNIITFVKAKLTGNSSLRDVKTLEDFYTGLVSGRFASDMRINVAGSRIEDYGPGGRGDLDVDWSKVPADAEEMAIRIIEIQEKIAANKQAQLRMMDEIKDTAQKLMEEAQALNKGVPAKLDVQSYVDVQLTNDLKKAFKANNSTGAVQAVLNKAIEEANPYVSRSSVIAARAAEEAYKFRKKVYRDMKVKENIYGKKKGDKFNDLVDKVTEEIITKTTGEKKNLTAIDDAELTRILNNNDDPHTIRYMLNGVEQRMVLSGKGSEALVQEFYAPEATVKSGIRKILGLGNSVAQAKRYLTTSADPTRVLPNLMRDWSRGIVTTGGEILLSPDKLRTDAIENGNYTPEQVKKINNGFELAKQAVDESTLTASMQRPRKNRKKSMIRAMNEPQDGNAFTRFIYDRTESAGKLFSTLQDTAETFTRKRAMENAYYRELANATARGMKIDDAVKRATEAAYFYGREATVNFFRRGKLVAEVAQMVPYLSQNFASLESFKYAYLDNPIAVTRSLRATVSTYATLIAIALSNDESRKRYFMLSEYDRAHNIIVPLTNDLIVTIPMDETVAAFLTPYRRMVESLNGVDPEAFYLWAAEGLEALSPLDLSGFSEGDKINVVRGFEKIGSQVVPTWAQPILESMTGTDWYYGSNLRVDEDYVGSRTGNWTPTPGELTTRSKNSEVLSHVANATGIPQWIVQNIYSEYGGNVGQYFLNMLDKMSGATEEAQGGKEFFDSIFKPMTGADSDEASNAFWAGVNQLDAEKRTLQREIMTLNDKIKAATGEDKAELQQQRQDKINKYGTRISDFLNQYLSAFEITGGLTKSQANRIWRLYDIYDLNQNEQLYRVGSPEEYHDSKASKAANKEATNLAALSGLDKYYHTPIDDYHQTYAQQMFRNTIYGEGTQRMVDIANILEDTSDYNNSFTKLRSDMYEARKKAFDAQDWDTYDKLAYQYDFKILSAVYPYLLEHGVAETLNKSEVMEYLKEWIVVPSEEMKTAKGRYVPNLGVDSEKSKAFKKQFIKKMYGVSGE